MRGVDAGARTSRPRWGLVGLFSAGHFLNDFYAVYLAALLPTLAVRFSLSGTAKGLLAGAFAICASLSQPFMGWLGDRVRRRAIIMLGMALSAVLMSLLAEAGSLWLVGLLLAGGGIGVSVYHPNSGALVREEAAGRDAAMAVFITSGALGVFAAPMFVRWCADEGHLGWLPWSMAAGLAMAAAIGLARPRPTSRAARLPRLRQLFRRAHVPMYLLVAVGVLRALAQLTFTNFILFHAREPGQAWSPAYQRLLLGGFLLAVAAGGIAGGFLSSRIGRRRVVVLSSLVGGAVLAVAPQPDVTATALGLVLGGLLFGAATPVCVVMAQDLAPAHAATATGVMTGFAWGLGALLLPAIGAIEDAATAGWALRAGAAAACAAGLLARLLAEPAPRPVPAPVPVLPAK